MKKCIVLDLDNTLWGGVVGEDGINGIALSMLSPGNSFIAFQQALLDLYNKGIILAINSRNNPDDAWEVIRKHPNMILKENHFAASRINWNDKATNIRELAKELNIGLDSLVFLDDDKANRELVRSLVPEVEVPELPEDPKEYTKFLHSLPYFSTTVVTDEDTMRGNFYVTERLRKEQEKQFSSKEEFLKSLSLELHIFKNDASCVPRLAQLTEKTNQFNTLKNPKSEQDIHAYIQGDTHDIYYASLKDTFGDHGVILFALVQRNGTTWVIESLLMSCRVFGRHVEDSFLAHLITTARKEGVEEIHILSEETPKNIPARDFIKEFFILNKRNVKDDVHVKSFVTLHTYENI
jgi:FkbH-like protein